MRTSGQKITDILEAQDRSVRALAGFAFIPEATLRLHIGNDEFTMKELGRIADALDVDARTLLPDSLLKIATPGGGGR